SAKRYGGSFWIRSAFLIWMGNAAPLAPRFLADSSVFDKLRFSRVVEGVIRGTLRRACAAPAHYAGRQSNQVGHFARGASWPETCSVRGRPSEPPTMGTPTTCARILSLLGALLLLSATAPASRAAPGDISTVAGGASSGSALLLGQSPMGVAISVPRVYVADAPRGVIRLIDTTTGVETVVAGNGASGFAGDGGPATAAELSYPTGVALDTAGDLFIADQDNSVVRKVDGTTGAISTVAGMAEMVDLTGEGD